MFDLPTLNKILLTYLLTRLESGYIYRLFIHDLPHVNPLQVTLDLAYSPIYNWAGDNILGIDIEYSR